MKKLLIMLVLTSLYVGCSKDLGLKGKVATILKENPEILTEAIQANPAEIMVALQKAAENARGAMAKKREEEEKKKLERAYDQPLQPKIRKDETFRGNKNAAITLVEYSDFECPYCSRGFQTVLQLMKKYGKNLRFVYKHLPLSFHKNAMLASQYYEAIRLQNAEKAFKFHDEIYKNQKKLKQGEKFLKDIAKKVGANMAKLAKNIKSKKVMDRIKEDQKEAASFGMQGTPGFVLNGIPVKGAYPVTHFDGIIEELKKRGKLKL